MVLAKTCRGLSAIYVPTRRLTTTHPGAGPTVELNGVGIRR
jgi:hypothetical protein